MSNPLVSVLVAICLLVLMRSACLPSVNCYSTAGVSLFSHQNKLDEKMGSQEEAAEQSFQQFIHSKPDSTIIGELKPNSSELELMLLKNKIASTIMSIQEMEKAGGDKLYSSPTGGADCFIEVTRNQSTTAGRPPNAQVERVAGKCRKVNNGLPICQSNNYMAINSNCN